MPELSVVVPTFNERENVGLLVDRVAKALATIDFELIVVDDSTDGTEQVLADLARIEPRLRVVHRAERRGLAVAVTDGIQLATGTVVCVLDADLQHPAEALPTLREALDHAGADLAIGSRYIPGGRYEFSLARKIVSRVATIMAKILIGRARAIADPLSGFFAFRRDIVEGVHLQPIGFKILLEVLARGRIQRVVEVPYSFAARGAGASKLTAAQNLQYMRHLLLLSRVRASPVQRVIYSKAVAPSSRGDSHHP